MQQSNASSQDGGSSAVAFDLVRLARAKGGPLVYVDVTGDRLAQIAGAARQLGQELEVLRFPAYDILPYDRMAPTAAIVGERIATRMDLAQAPTRRRLLITSARAVFALVPPFSQLAGQMLQLGVGDAVDPDALGARLAAWGFVADDRVDEPGEFAVRGHVIDVYPGDAAAPLRIAIEDGRVTGLTGYDPVTQRSTEDLGAVSLRPVMEIDPVALRAGPEGSEGFACVLDALPGMRLLLAPGVAERWAELQDEAADAYATIGRAQRAPASRGGAYLPPPERLFMTAERLAELEAAQMAEPVGTGSRIAPFHRARDAAAAIEAGLRTGRVVVAVGRDERVRGALARTGAAVREAESVEAALSGPDGSAALLRIRLPSGFAREGLTVLAAAERQERRSITALPIEEPPRIGDVVVHRDHGVCRIAGLSIAEGEERVALEFAGSKELLISVQELDRIWRYGSEGVAIALDPLRGDAWQARRGEIAAEVEATARAIKDAAAARARLRAPVVEAGASVARFAARFPYPLSLDQEAAIEAVFADLRSGRPMDRLVCGDVGFGKTEVALRAAAAVAFAGHQVAVMAPTSVLARQHFDLFERRFARFGLRIAPLLRGAGSKAMEATRAGLADGSISIVVGTQAVASPGIRFKALGLVVIDEEQRFGDAEKKRLAGLRGVAGGVHGLTMTATPIPRTLQGAMVGLREISVIATPPQRRQPIRTFVLPYDAAVVREALMREHRRGGQSFVICPRIEDLDPIRARLSQTVPELDMAVAHGRLKPLALEGIVAAFGSGEHDVLIATNIIEAGIDLPRANTILIMRPERFGLSQLHQMRGRVGRGERRGAAYLLSDAGVVLPKRTQRRLATLAAHERLGAGFAISRADMDARGAGDLFGAQQAGHVHAIGTELYQLMLAAALASEDGTVSLPPTPALNVAVPLQIPAELVPEADLRLELYRRMAGMGEVEEAVEFLEEFEDRFGPVPPGLAALPDTVAVRAWCLSHGIDRVDAGPQAVALTTADPARGPELGGRLGGARVKGDRVILPIAVAAAETRLAALRAALA